LNSSSYFMRWTLSFYSCRFSFWS